MDEIQPNHASGTTCERPIFIVGAPRSGTTLLRSILDAHPNICCPTWETGVFDRMEPLLNGDFSVAASVASVARAGSCVAVTRTRGEERGESRWPRALELTAALGSASPRSLGSLVRFGDAFLDEVLWVFLDPTVRQQ